MNKNTAGFIFPHQLFANHPIIKQNPKLVFILEDPLFFGDERYKASFHRSKRVLHRATLKRFVAENIKIECSYIEYQKEFKKFYKKIIKELKAQKITKIICIDPTDTVLRNRLEAQFSDFELVFLENPNFLSTKSDLESYFKKNSFYHAKFYTWQRKRFEILTESVDGEIVPILDENKERNWSYDDKNRKKLPKGHIPPKVSFYGDNEYVGEAKKYVEKTFTDSVGFSEFSKPLKDSTKVDASEKVIFIYPTNHKEAEAWLNEFLDERVELFGDFEDAFHSGFPFIYHSVLTPMLNIGLLSPQQILKAVTDLRRSIPINSREGFTRQILGWREFMRATYELKGSKMRTKNFFNHTNKLSKHLYDGSTGVLPIDIIINSLNRYAYSHHIERLMFIGNFFLLLELDPNEVYRWFMEMYIDSYDWVMVPNVYGMSQFADGGSIVTKPYFSSSNYIKKMSNLTGKEKTKSLNTLLDSDDYTWADIWDALFWRFVNKHSDYLKKNARMGFVVSNLEKKKSEDLQDQIKLADTYIKKITT